MSDRRFPLAKLIQLREHRTEKARQHVLQCQRAAREQQDACLRIEGQIMSLGMERDQQRLLLMQPPPLGTAWPLALAQRESHVELLGTRLVQARQALAKAQEVLREAELAVRKAREEFFRTKAREDALLKRREVWRGERHAAEIRQEENAAAELLQSRPARRAMN